MQNSSEFQYVAIDQIHESATNPRRTFDEAKLYELAESIRGNGLIQPITVRPNNTGFEIVAGARRFRAAQLAELFSLPARIVDIDDAQALEWQLVENSQRVDVHPYEEAQGFERLLDMPGYDVATLVEKSGKSPAHVYARLSLLQLIPSVAEAFGKELITASHANLLARLPQEHQLDAYAMCWRKDWADKEPHLLPAKHLSAWIQNNLFLSLAEAPFSKEDTTSTHPPEPASPALAAVDSTPLYLPMCRATSASTLLAFTQRWRPISTARSPPVPSLCRSRTVTAARRNRGPEPSSAATSARSSTPATPTPSRFPPARQPSPPSSSTASG